MLTRLHLEDIYVPASCIVIEPALDAVTGLLSQLLDDLIADIVVILVPAVLELLVRHILLEAFSATFIIDTDIEQLLHDVVCLLLDVRLHGVRRIDDARLELHIRSLLLFYTR